MISFECITINGKTYSPEIFRMFNKVLHDRHDRRKKKAKEPKGRAEDGSYCPKKKPGQSWSYIKDNVEKDNDREDVA